MVKLPPLPAAITGRPPPPLAAPPPPLLAVIAAPPVPDTVPIPAPAPLDLAGPLLEHAPSQTSEAVPTSEKRSRLVFNKSPRAKAFRRAEWYH
jgi:hypothetical protein